MEERLLLLELARWAGSPRESVVVSTSQLGQLLGVSQQTASRRLRALADEGLVEVGRTSGGQEVRFTPKGLAALESLQSELSDFLGAVNAKPAFSGVVTSGLGEGAYYVRAYSSRLKIALGYAPFEGTLNLKIEGALPDFSRHTTEYIQSFKSGGRSFGGLAIAPVTLKVGSKKVSCHLILPERTHHKGQLEFIFKSNLKKKLGVEAGDEVGVSLS